MEDPFRDFRPINPRPPRVSGYAWRMVLGKLGLFCAIPATVWAISKVQQEFGETMVSGVGGVLLIGLWIVLLLKWDFTPSIACPGCAQKMKRELGPGWNGPHSYLLVCRSCRLYHDLNVGED